MDALACSLGGGLTFGRGSKHVLVLKEVLDGARGHVVSTRREVIDEERRIASCSVRTLAVRDERIGEVEHRYAEGAQCGLDQMVYLIELPFGCIAKRGVVRKQLCLFVPIDPPAGRHDGHGERRASLVYLTGQLLQQGFGKSERLAPLGIGRCAVDVPCEWDSAGSRVAIRGGAGRRLWCVGGLRLPANGESAMDAVVNEEIEHAMAPEALLQPADKGAGRIRGLGKGEVVQLEAALSVEAEVGLGLP